MRQSRYTYASLVALVSTIGCHSPSENSDPRACNQTYEFGNTGCFEATGEVLNSAAKPLAGAQISLRTFPNSDVFAFNSAWTDSAGRFRVRGTRMSSRASAPTTPDTVSVYLIAFYPPTLARDSVVATVTIAPIGAIPEQTVVRVSLRNP